MNHQQSEMEAHEQAMEDTAARYFLDELSEAERDVFEEHFFDCSVCAATVRAGETLFAAGREAVAKDREKPELPNVVPITSDPRGRRMAPWWSQAAAAVMAFAFAGNVYLTHQPTMEAVRLVNISTDARGPSQTVYRLSHGEELELSVDVPPGFPCPTYEIGVRTAKGKTIDSMTISAETAKNTQFLLLRKLPAGSYVLVIEGVRADGNRVPVTSNGFTVQR
jgi:hypothetical protein